MGRGFFCYSKFKMQNSKLFTLLSMKMHAVA